MSDTEINSIDEDFAKEIEESLSERIQRLSKEKDDIEIKILATTASLKRWRAKFCPKNSGSKGRLQKGEADRLIAAHFTTFPEKGFTIAEIATATGVNFSSARNVLKRDEEKYSVGSDNLWRKK